MKVFCMLFPWLYPGGNGDYLENRNIKITPMEWAKYQLQYADGRFSEDKIWCFYAQNYCQRRRNMDQGYWFVRVLTMTIQLIVSPICRKDWKRKDQNLYLNYNISPKMYPVLMHIGGKRNRNYIRG